MRFKLALLLVMLLHSTDAFAPTAPAMGVPEVSSFIAPILTTAMLAGVFWIRNIMRK